jgi:molybdenum cofactor cytidylyltransferase
MKKKRNNTKTEIWAIILAAGESKRMKTPKMLLPFKGKTIIEKVIENVVSSDVDNTVVVIGASHNEILNIIAEMPVMHCYNDNYKKGMLSSVICGFQSLPENIEGAVVFQGDQPMISAPVINTLINAWRKSGKGIVIPVFEKKRGHPIFIAKKYINEIAKLNPDEGLRSLTVKFRDDVSEVEVETPEILRDIDTKEDYENEINQT